jgi:hypothetical protein
MTARDSTTLGKLKAEFQHLMDHCNHGEGWPWLLRPSHEVAVVHIRGDEAGKHPGWKEATVWAKAYLRGTYINEATGWAIHVGSNGIQEGIHRLAAAAHPEAIAGVPALLAHCLPVYNANDLLARENIRRVHTMAGGLRIGHSLYRAMVTVRDTTLGMTYYGHHIGSLDTKMSGDLGEVPKPGGHSSDSHPPDSIRLGLLLRGFKPPRPFS